MLPHTHTPHIYITHTTCIYTQHIHISHTPHAYSTHAHYRQTHFPHTTYTTHKPTHTPHMPLTYTPHIHTHDCFLLPRASSRLFPQPESGRVSAVMGSSPLCHLLAKLPEWVTSSCQGISLLPSVSLMTLWRVNLTPHHTVVYCVLVIYTISPCVSP